MPGRTRYVASPEFLCPYLPAQSHSSPQCGHPLRQQPQPLPAVAPGKASRWIQQLYCPLACNLELATSRERPAISSVSTRSACQKYSLNNLRGHLALAAFQVLSRHELILDQPFLTKATA